MAQPVTKTHWRSVIRRSNEDMLFAEDLGGYGCKPVDVEIIDSGVKSVKGRGKAKPMPWLQFAGKNGPSKKLGLGAGMCKVMQTLSGTDIVEEWRGWITLIVVKTKYTDEDTGERLETDAIRIEPARPKPRTGTPSATSQPASSPPPISTSAETAKTDELTDADKRAIELAEAEEARRG